MIPQCSDWWEKNSVPGKKPDPRIIENVTKNEIIVDEDWGKKYDVLLGVMIPLILIAFAIMIVCLLKFLKARKDAAGSGGG